MKPEERRAQILEHATELFGSKGYHNTSVTDIIQAAGVARGTFYLYFEGKYAIFEELLDGLLERLTGRIRTIDTAQDAPSPKQQILDNVTRIVELFVQERALLAILLKGAVGLEPELDDKLSDFYHKTALLLEHSLNLGTQLGLVRDCDTQIAALAALGMLKEILHHILRRGDSEVDINNIASNLYDIFAGGVLKK